MHKRLFVRVLQVPIRFLLPGVTIIAFVGVYGISGSAFDLLLMVGFGLLGYVFRKLDVPLVPIVLGILLGNLMETNLRRAFMISDGDFQILYGSNLAIAIWIVVGLAVVLPRVLRMRQSEEGA